MPVFTNAELAYLQSQPLMRFVSASPSGKPDVAPVVFSVDGDDIVTGALISPTRSATKTSSAILGPPSLLTTWRP